MATFDNRPVDDAIWEMTIAELAREGVQVSVERRPAVAEGLRLAIGRRHGADASLRRSYAIRDTLHR